MALITGDPDRVPLIASHFENPREITRRRGFVCFEASHEGRPLIIASTGVGAPATAIVAEELLDLGVSLIIRVGTCGGLNAAVKPGDLIIASASVRDEGTSAQYIDPTYPAVAHPALVHELSAAASSQGTRHHIGIVHSKDAYYMESVGKQVDPRRISARWAMWRHAGVLATEMECSTLFVIASLRGGWAAAVLVVVGAEADAVAFGHSLSAAVGVVQLALSRLAAGSRLPPKRIASPDAGSFLDSRRWDGDDEGRQSDGA